MRKISARYGVIFPVWWLPYAWATHRMRKISDPAGQGVGVTVGAGVGVVLGVGVGATGARTTSRITSD
jgi:hypothetical protein